LQISVDSIKALRDRTDAGIMDCKRALQSADGNLGRAEELLKQQGIASASKKASRETNQGIVDSYIHSGGRIGAMVELNCETDFVARTDGFRTLAHDLAMQVAAMAPAYLDSGDIPPGADSNPQEICLMLQPFIKDPTMTVQDLVNETVGKLGENVRVRRFSRFSLGE
jgi:elongation factor Ts